MKTNRGNRKALYTKRMFAQALLELLKETPYRSLTVSALCEAAGCSRPSFYRNFDSIDEVFAFFIEDKIDGFIAGRKSSKTEKSSVDTAILELWGGERNFVELIMRRGLLNDFIMTVCHYLYELQNERNPEPGGTSANEREMDSQYRSAMQAYYTGAVLYAWVERGLVDKPEEVRRVLARIRDE